MHRIKKQTTENARQLRKNMTDAERVLWQALREKRLYGYKFRRQYPIGSYIADFACIDEFLVIELDGGQHQDQLKYDEDRTSFLQQNGWQVIRFWNNEVLNNLEGILFVLAEKLRVKDSTLKKITVENG